MSEPKPDRDGLYAAADFHRGSNPDWEPWVPVRHSADGRSALIDGGIVWEASQLGQSLPLLGQGRAKR